MNFPTTRWTVFALDPLHRTARASEAFEHLCERYREPILAFLRHQGIASDDVEDVAHDFLLHLRDRETLRRVERDRGRFRSFLLGSLRHFLHDRAARLSAAKRGGGIPALPLDEVGPDALGLAAPSASDGFDRRWAQEILALSLARLNADEGNNATFPVLRAFLPGSLRVPSYDEAAAATGLTLANVKSEIHRLRQRFRAVLRREVAVTVGSAAEVDDEMAHLQRALLGEARAPHGAA